ncbi:hemocyte protein-glutamine gamma-glutamyltransferase isoform X2 [Patella vulgata]|nr:hemocyte protein-glutamine gamma-glutamyltransferase isoform X2 [Patella vulgata]
MYILDRSELKWPVRGNPINIIRQLTALVNASDDGGVIVGNWSRDFKDGKSPLTWTGSAPILQEFYINKQPVKFGQCWVFSGVLTTVCRALGIPARSVTNFSSAHDTDGSVSIDIHFDTNGEVDKSLTDDNIWNFHVWNEVWMTRPDLPEGYGGWQAVDSTPQETSDGVFCCGPASLVAVKRGELGLLYDVPFVFAEVNADIILWHLRDGSMINDDIRKNHVGKKISTKFPLYDQRQDITKLYKHEEDSHEERAAVINAHRQLGVAVRKSTYEIGPEDVEFELVVQDGVFVGEDFDVVLQVTNTSSADRTVGGQLAAKTMFYTGVEANRVKAELFEEMVEPGKSMEKTMRITFDEYRLKLKDMCMFKLSAMVKVQDTKQVFTPQKVIKLCKPSLSIKIPAKIKKAKSFDVEVSFTNPLGESLTNCYLEVEGPGLQKRQQHRLGNVDPHKAFETKFEMTSRKLGERELVIIFNSDQLEDINSTQVVDVID